MVRTSALSETPIDPPVRLSTKLDTVLRAYATAATATGVGFMVLVRPIEAKIVYTPAKVSIVPNNSIPLDLNHDGTVDFSFKDTTFRTSFGGGGGALSVVPTMTANQIWGHLRGVRRNASALYPGVQIGPKGKFAPGANLMASTQINSGLPPAGPGTCSGPWANVTNRYLGIKFTISGKVHFGWARLSVSCPLQSLMVTAELTGYAYETVANKAIRTGQRKRAPGKPRDAGTGGHTADQETATLGKLARGATTQRSRGEKDGGYGE